MNSKFFRPFIVFTSIIFIVLCTQNAFSFWVWTPETNKWVNPKYSVKDTPAEQLKLGIDLFELKEYKDASKEFKKLLKHYPRAREAPEAQFYIGKCFQNQEFPFKAFKQYQKVIDRYPFSELAGEIVQTQYDLGIKLLDGQTQRNSIVTTLAGRNYDVIEIFKAVIKNAPYGDLAAPSQYKIGLYLFEHNLYQEARDEFEKVLNDYPDSEWTKVAKYQIALTDSKRSTEAQYDQKVTQAAAEEFKDFVKEYPSAQLSENATNQILKLKSKEAENNFVVAQFYEKQKNYTSAKVYYKIIVDDYKNSQWASKALAKIRELSEKEK